MRLFFVFILSLSLLLSIVLLIFSFTAFLHPPQFSASPSCVYPLLLVAMMSSLDPLLTLLPSLSLLSCSFNPVCFGLHVQGYYHGDASLFTSPISLAPVSPLYFPPLCLHMGNR